MSYCTINTMAYLPTVLGAVSLVFFLIFPINHVKSEPTNPKLVDSFLQIYTNCSITQDRYALNSEFHQNLKIVFSNLTFAASITNASFYNSSLGQKNDAVFSLYLCRGDQTPAECSSCIRNVTQSLIEDCPNRPKEAIKWVQGCLLRYANRNIFSKEEESPFINWVKAATFIPPKNVTLPPPPPHPFNQTETLFNLINATAFGNNLSMTSTRFFATKEEEITPSWYNQTFYSLALCTPDITPLLCHKCLIRAFVLLGGGTEATAYLPSCHLRYGLRKFYNTSGDTSLTSIPPSDSPLPSSIVPPQNGLKGHKKPKGLSYLPIAIAIPSAVVLLLLSGLFCLRRKLNSHTPSKDEIIVMESLQYDINAINTATNYFSEDNKLGQGRFGAVYKGKLQNGQEIAIRRLSRKCCQGIQEFKVEVRLFANLQHRNLVRILGFCATKEEKMLVHEFMQNSSLDRLLFDAEKCASLAWKTRYKIIEGIAKGLLYLHEHSQLKIIHGDLKPSNILLDKDMTPKIADFAITKLMGEDQVQAISGGVFGTPGYTAPEWSGQLYMKFDIYSFGVIILEIVSGQRLMDISIHTTQQDGLLQRAWKLWNAKELLALVDPTMKGNFSAEEVTRCIHIGLSCVQEEAEKRPSISAILSLLNSHSSNLSELVPGEGYNKSDNSISSLGLNQSTNTYSGMEDITTLSAR